ncbi:MAG: hypothetical protein KA314_04500 [Chloroflexi bacterium]|nr:hypothetical protein [Chloroflexota bacterium]
MAFPFHGPGVGLGYCLSIIVHGLISIVLLLIAAASGRNHQKHKRHTWTA